MLHEFQAPESSIVSDACYDDEQMLLRVTLRKPTGHQETYRFGPVPNSTWKEFEVATSKGAFFAKHIRPMFNGTKER